MPDEQVSYLEPIEENVSDVFQKPERRSPTIESPEAPDRSMEKTSSQESEAVYRKILAASSQETQGESASTDRQSEIERISGEPDIEARVNRLTTLAQTRGVAYAVSVAQKLNDFYLLDRMHDDLANRLYESLKTKGLIKDE